jgi:hypothetical protein
MDLIQLTLDKIPMMNLIAILKLVQEWPGWAEVFLLNPEKRTI